MINKQDFNEDHFSVNRGSAWFFYRDYCRICYRVFPLAQSPNPSDGILHEDTWVNLSWRAGDFAVSHNVYIGDNFDDVDSGVEGTFVGSQEGTFIVVGFPGFPYPDGLVPGTTYYWRIDEANNANADSPWTGPLWSFTTANFLIVDDFEAYNDLNEDEPGSNRIYLAWIDGFENPAVNGSVVGNLDPPFAEQIIVHGGLQSMPMAYDNAVGKSEATLTLTSNRDWTVNGVTTLTIWFRGASANAAESLYVALNGGTPVANDDPDAALTTAWTEWNIDLQAFGVNLSNVNSITLGLSSVTGGTGMMYFDDIRLYAPAQ